MSESIIIKIILFPHRPNTINIRNLDYPLPLAFSSVFSALLLIALINWFGISNPTISNFHYVKLFSWTLQRSLGLFSFRYLERFHFTSSNVERIHSKTLIECLSFLTSTKKHVGHKKTRLNVKSLGKEYLALKYGVPKNTISTWTKNKS